MSVGGFTCSCEIFNEQTGGEGTTGLCDIINSKCTENDPSPACIASDSTTSYCPADNYDSATPGAAVSRADKFTLMPSSEKVLSKRPSMVPPSSPSLAIPATLPPTIGNNTESPSYAPSSGATSPAPSIGYYTAEEDLEDALEAVESNALPSTFQRLIWPIATYLSVVAASMLWE